MNSSPKTRRLAPRMSRVAAGGGRAGAPGIFRRTVRAGAAWTLRPTARAGVTAALVTAVCSLVVAGCGYLAPRNLSPGPAVEADGIRFRFFAPAARRVQLAGDWPENNWARGDGGVGEANVGLMLDADGDGIWEITVPLPPGRYKYLFWVDENTWHLDPGNPEEVPGGPAGTCSLVVLYGTLGNLEIR
jgi:hypothetical protein